MAGEGGQGDKDKDEERGRGVTQSVRIGGWCRKQATAVVVDNTLHADTCRKRSESRHDSF